MPESPGGPVMVTRTSSPDQSSTCRLPGVVEEPAATVSAAVVQEKMREVVRDELSRLAHELRQAVRDELRRDAHCDVHLTGSPATSGPGHQLEGCQRPRSQQSSKEALHSPKEALLSPKAAQNSLGDSAHLARRREDRKGSNFAPTRPYLGISAEIGRFLQQEVGGLITPNMNMGLKRGRKPPELSIPSSPLGASHGHAKAERDKLWERDCEPNSMLANTVNSNQMWVRPLAPDADQSPSSQEADLKQGPPVLNVRDSERASRSSQGSLLPGPCVGSADEESHIENHMVSKPVADAPSASEIVAKGSNTRNSVLGISNKKPKANEADRAIGLAPQQTADFSNNPEDENAKTWQRKAEIFVRSGKMEIVMSIMTLASVINVGAQTDDMARNLLEMPGPAYRVLDGIFCAYFVLEIALRIFAFQKRFLYMYGWGWNIFDLFLAVSQLVEEVVQATMTGSEFVSRVVLRIVRILRLIRTLRVLHVIVYASELRMLVSCIIQSAKAFVWAFALIFVILYIVGVCFTHMVLVHKLDYPQWPTNGELNQWYGSVPRSVLSLFQGLTGGVDWNDIADPLMTSISPWMGLFFFLYTAFSIILVMNVVTATFVEGSIQRAGKMQEMQQLAYATRLFKSLDRDNSGFITLDEIENHLECAEVQNFFQSINVDVTEVRAVFKVLDMDESGRIEFWEFLSGCLRLQGPAKSIDLVLGIYHISRNVDRLVRRLDSVEAEVDSAA